MRISVAVSTIGRESLSLLLESLQQQTMHPHEVVIADQGPDGLVEKIIAPYKKVLPVRAVRSTRGVSCGRNASAHALTACDAIFFTDDDCALRPNTLALAAQEILDGTDIVTGRVTSSLGSRGQRDLGPRRVLDRNTVWAASLEANMTFSVDAFLSLGGFDESLGVGSPTPWQSGEGTEVMIRALDLKMFVVHNPDIEVVESTSPLSSSEAARKSRRYARGTGRVYAMHYALSAHLVAVLRPLAGAGLRAIQGRFRESRLLFNAALGRVSALPTRRESRTSENEARNG